MNEDKILQYVMEGPTSFIDIARQLQIDRNDNKILSDKLNQMVVENKIGKTEKGDFFKYKFISEGQGIFKSNPKGFGFVDIPEQKSEKDSIYFSKLSRNDALTGDFVEYKIFLDPTTPSRKIGLITKVVKRAKTEFVGSVVQNGQYRDFVPLMTDFGIRARLVNQDTVNPNHYVKAEIQSIGGGIITLRVVKDLGKTDAPHTDIDALVVDSGIPIDFSEQVIADAKAIPQKITIDPKEERVDLREELIVTIDGDDSKDYDDAINVKKLKNGNYFLGVHIADVTNYVKEANNIDEEALARGTSVYLVDRVIPMLPFELSNGICSLNPNEDRFTITCEMEIDSTGKTISKKVYPSIIQSKHRLTYNKVNDLFYDREKFEDEKLNEMLVVSLELSKIIRNRKLAEGYIDFNIDETKFILDENTGKTKEIKRKKQDIAESLIEDFMVKANESVAEIIEEKGLPFIYRVHDKPMPDKVEALAGIVKVLGLENLHVPKEMTSLAFSKFAIELKEQRFDEFIKLMLLQAMAKAIYSDQNIGHFGLASKSYTHFTSPIRRYPDLMVHRMLREYIFLNKADSLAGHFKEILPQIALQSSTCEQRAQELERVVDDLKKTEFYEQYIGQEKMGQIVSIKKFGMFIEFEDKVDGLLHVENMFGEQYEITTNELQMKSKSKTFTIGDSIAVVIAAIDKQARRIDLVLPQDFPKFKEVIEIRQKQAQEGNSRGRRDRGGFSTGRDRDRRSNFSSGGRNQGNRGGFRGNRSGFGGGNRGGFGGSRERRDGDYRGFSGNRDRRDGEGSLSNSDGQRRSFGENRGGFSGNRDRRDGERSFSNSDGQRRSFGENRGGFGGNRDRNNGDRSQFNRTQTSTFSNKGYGDIRHRSSTPRTPQGKPDMDFGYPTTSNSSFGSKTISNKKFNDKSKEKFSRDDSNREKKGYKRESKHSFGNGNDWDSE